jgi:Ni/Fe-hydrogenase 1 B-type cytochrome subunit
MSNGTTTMSQPELVSVYVWEWPVRITHWLIATAIVVLAVTGFYIGRPFITAPNPATQSYVMGTMKAIHFYAAIVFTLSELSRIAWMFLGNRYARWDQLIPLDRERRRGLWPWLKFYILAEPKTPKFVGHNPLAGLSYFLVYVLCLVAALTGYALFSMEAGAGSPMRVFGTLLPFFGGAQTARWIHHVIMWLIVLFIVHHIACAFLVSRVTRNGTIDSMFTGFRFVKPGDLTEAAEVQE